MKQKILVMGGCHVEGYLVGENNSFVNVFSKRLKQHDISHQILTKSKYLIKSPEILVEKYQEFCPDILILQVGNYEFSPDFIKILKKRLNMRYKKIKEPNDSSPISKCFIPSFLFKIKMYIKLLVIMTLAYPFLYSDKLTKQAEDLFCTISSLNIPKTIILSPFPCPDISTLYYRYKGDTILKQLCLKYNFEYINVIDLYYQYTDIYTDVAHLNIKGHSLIGTYLEERIYRYLQKK